MVEEGFLEAAINISISNVTPEAIRQMKNEKKNMKTEEKRTEPQHFAFCRLNLVPRNFPPVDNPFLGG